MEEKENYGFCPACGANLPENSAFCPECGQRVSGEEPAGQSGYTGYQPYRNTDRLAGKLLVAVIFCGLYAAMSIIGGLQSLSIDSSSLDEADDFLESFMDMTLEEMMEMNRNEILDYLHINGIVSMISGVLAGAGAIVAGMRKQRFVAVGLVVAASVACFGVLAAPGAVSSITGIILDVIIGLVMAYLIYSSPEYFNE